LLFRGASGGEQSAVLLAKPQEQIPHFARNDSSIAFSTAQKMFARPNKSMPNTLYMKLRDTR
jgi:hypothetical protein